MDEQRIPLEDIRRSLRENTPFEVFGLEFIVERLVVTEEEYHTGFSQTTARATLHRGPLEVDMEGVVFAGDVIVHSAPVGIMR